MIWQSKGGQHEKTYRGSDCSSSVDGNCFSPSTTLYRGQLVTILYRMAGKPELTETVSFPDVAETDYFKTAAQWAVSAGIVDCCADGSFMPGGTVTRETLAGMLYKYFLFEGTAADGAVRRDRVHAPCPRHFGSL